MNRLNGCPHGPPHSSHDRPHGSHGRSHGSDGRSHGPHGRPHGRVDIREQNRAEELSRPKQATPIWATEFGPRAQWGTQDPLRPVTQASLRAVATQRTVKLAQPKPDRANNNQQDRHLYLYSSGRQSGIWHVNNKALAATCSQRINQLAKPKMSPRYIDKQMRSRPGAMTAYVKTSTNRTADISRIRELARARGYHDDYKPSRPVQTIISRELLEAPLREKSETLATLKQRPAGLFRDAEWPVSTSAKSVSASGRCQELATPRPLPATYQLNRPDATWPVSRHAMRAQPSGRTMELSMPIARGTMDQVLYDSDAFRVAPAALQAICSPRIRVLATPVMR